MAKTMSRIFCDSSQIEDLKEPKATRIRKPRKGLNLLSSKKDRFKKTRHSAEELLMLTAYKVLLKGHGLTD